MLELGLYCGLLDFQASVCISPSCQPQTLLLVPLKMVSSGSERKWLCWRQWPPVNQNRAGEGMTMERLSKSPACLTSETSLSLYTYSKVIIHQATVCAMKAPNSTDMSLWSFPAMAGTWMLIPVWVKSRECCWRGGAPCISSLKSGSLLEGKCMEWGRGKGRENGRRAKMRSLYWMLWWKWPPPLIWEFDESRYVGEGRKLSLDALLIMDLTHPGLTTIIPLLALYAGWSQTSKEGGREDGNFAFENF